MLPEREDHSREKLKARLAGWNQPDKTTYALEKTSSAAVKSLLTNTAAVDTVGDEVTSSAYVVLSCWFPPATILAFSFSNTPSGVIFSFRKHELLMTIFSWSSGSVFFDTGWKVDLSSRLVHSVSRALRADSPCDLSAP